MKRTYVFSQLGTIPGIPGEFHAGEIVTIDEETMQIVERKATSLELEKPKGKTKEQKES
jgi:hypothetical protein